MEIDYGSCHSYKVPTEILFYTKSRCPACLRVNTDSTAIGHIMNHSLIMKGVVRQQ